MEVWVTGQPHLLYETVELLFAYVNRIPADAGCGLCRYFPG